MPVRLRAPLLYVALIVALSLKVSVLLPSLKLSTSPLAMKPLLITTVAPESVVLNGSARLRPASSVTAVVLPPSKVAVAPAVTCGPASRVTELVAWAEVEAASETVQSMVRVPVFGLVVLKLIESSADW